MNGSGVVFLSLRELANIVISRPGGGPDHQTGFRNGKLRRFAIGAVYHFFLWDGLSEKLEHFESTTENFGTKKSNNSEKSRKNREMGSVSDDRASLN